ncbi:VTT domain-containing protein [Aeromicrobium sp. CF3.5]|uniref:VTT domain-containing protein n=1 Tax=Aeromicrobium sp. CF3.5 TaxID=3373078 RepID=UPI003EE68036
MNALSLIGEALSGLEAAVVTLGTSPQTMVVIVLLCWLDGFFPLVPSESVVIAVASTLIGSGGSIMDVALLVAAAAFGAFCGDMTAYALGSRFRRNRWGLARTAQGRNALTRAHASLEQRGSSYVLAGRFVPAGRVFISMAAGATGYSRAQFTPLAALGSVMWGAWVSMLGVGAGHVLRDQPLLAVVVGVVVGVMMGLLVDRLLRALRTLKRADPPGMGSRPRAMVSAHRGAARQSGSRDNSWESLVSAMQMPVEYVEFDLHRTADGEFVLHHGSRALGVDGRRRRISSSAYVELLEAGEGPLPRYRDGLELLSAHGKRAHIDLKFTDPTGGSAADEIRAAEIALAVMGESSAFLITTLADASVRALRDWAEARSPGTLVGLSLGLHRWPSALFPGRRLRRCGANAVAVDHRVGCFRLLTWAHRQNMPVLVWTVDEGRPLRRLLTDPRVWMVVTNHPGRATLSSAGVGELTPVLAA